MKLFQKLLLAPAALGLMAPVAASAYEISAAPGGMNDYIQQGDLHNFRVWADQNQVTSVTQFADVQPTDWAYQALSNLIEKYGCVAGYPDGTFKGKQALTRYEAAALLNACLDRVTEITDELQRLQKEFAKELAVLKGRVDGLEAKVGELQATQFSTTTKLRADTRWVLGGVSYDGNQRGGNNNWGATQLRDALSFNYDVRLNFDTSFTGKDLLRTQLRAGNFSDSAFSTSNTVTPLTNLDAAFQENLGTGVDGGDVVAINRLYYKFPIGKEFTAVVGPRVRQDEALPLWPSIYSADKILKIFQYAGAPGAYSQVLGSGAGLWWKQAKRDKKDTSGKWAFGVNYVAGNGDGGQPNNVGGSSSSNSGANANGGIGNNASAQSSTAQLGYTAKNWNITGAYTFNSSGVSIVGTPLSVALLPSNYTNTAAGTTTSGTGSVSSWSLAGYWQPLQTGWIPAISAGWGYNTYRYGGGVANTTNVANAASQSWYTGLNWKDAFLKGNALGFAFGQPTFLTAITGKTGSTTKNNVQDGNYAFELFYKIQATDNIAITPAIFWLSRARGEVTDSASTAASALRNPGISGGDSLGTFGALVQTTFKF
jgi:hypothetical protein